MKVKVRYFSQLREHFGCDGEEFVLADGAVAADLLTKVFASKKSGDRDEIANYLRVAINAAFVSLTTPLTDGDEVVFITPVAGG